VGNGARTDEAVFGVCGPQPLNPKASTVNQVEEYARTINLKP